MMKKVVHLSDIHFGKVDVATVEPLIEAVKKIEPNLVVVSGDLTQRARTHQFQEAQEFLNKLPAPQIVVPGNHDIPLWNPWSRFVDRLTKYRINISDNLYPTYQDDGIAAIGINTARSLTTKYGRINREQIQRIKSFLCSLPDDRIKMVVTHHPFDLPEGYRDRQQIVGRSRLAMHTLADCGIDLFLAGHLHLSFIGSTAARYKVNHRSALIVQAGTATSVRGRGEPNAFNVILCEHPCISIERYEWDSNQAIFNKATSEGYEHTDTGWTKLPAPPKEGPETINP